MALLTAAQKTLLAKLTQKLGKDKVDHLDPAFQQYNMGQILGILADSTPLGEATAANVLTAINTLVKATDAGAPVMVHKAIYNHAVDGGLVSSIALGTALPTGAVPIRSYWNVITPLTSGGGAKIALGIETSNTAGISGAAAVLGTNGTAGWHDGESDGASTNFGSATAAGQKIEIAISVAALTAGKLEVFVEYFIPAT